MDFLLAVLQPADPSAMTPSKTDGALHMIGALADILLKKRVYREKMEQFLVQMVFPVFKSEFGHLRARACWMLHYFAGMWERERERGKNTSIEL